MSSVSCKLLVKDCEGDRDVTNNFQLQELPTRTIVPLLLCTWNTNRRETMAVFQTKTNFGRLTCSDSALSVWPEAKELGSIKDDGNITVLLGFGRIGGSKSWFEIGTWENSVKWDGRFSIAASTAASLTSAASESCSIGATLARVKLSLSIWVEWFLSLMGADRETSGCSFNW